MRKATRIGLALMMALVLAGSAAAAGTGRYEWRISFSNTDPNVQTAPNPAGLATLYLWYQGCNSVAAGPGMSASDFAVKVSGAWTYVGFNPDATSGFLNAGSGPNLLLAVGGCPSASELAGSITIFTAGDGAARLGLSNNNIAVVVDCTSPTPDPWSWPADVLFVGAKSNGFAGAQQAWGNGCTVDPVDAATWGGIKAIYR
ncbi:MAG: hypothetical protein U0167_02340 [bacterium]